MSWSRTVNAIRQRFDAEVAVPHDLVVVHGNQPIADTALGARWVRLSIQSATRDQVSTGRAKFRTAGIAFAVLLEAIGNGEGDQNELVDAIQSAFTQVSLQVTGTPALFVRFRPPFADGEARQDETGSWWERTVQIPFIADDFGGNDP